MRNRLGYVSIWARPGTQIIRGIIRNASPDVARAPSSDSEVLSKLCIVHYWRRFILCRLFGIDEVVRQSDC
jgi:hypothetical protein